MAIKPYSVLQVCKLMSDMLLWCQQKFCVDDIGLPLLRSPGPIIQKSKW